MNQVLEGAPTKVQREVWTCVACGFARTWTTKEACHKCGKARPTVTAAPAEAMECDGGQDGVAEIEGIIKAVRGAPAGATRDIMLSSLQERLQVAKDRARAAKPPHARLQSAIGRLTSSTAARELAEGKLKEAETTLLEAQKALAEARQREQDAQLELSACQAEVAQCAPMALPVVGPGQVIATVLAALGQVGLQQPQIMAVD